jgi:hypothetical protein
VRRLGVVPAIAALPQSFLFLETLALLFSVLTAAFGAWKQLIVGWALVFCGTVTTFLWTLSAFFRVVAFASFVRASGLCISLALLLTWTPNAVS